MIALLERAAAQAPSHTGVVSTEGSLTYAQMLEGARRVAAGLLARGLSRFAVVESDAGRVLQLLAGAALAGAEPCLYQPDIGAGAFIEEAARVGHDTVISRRSDFGEMRRVPPEALLDGGGEAPDRSPEHQPLMIRTTGTTGAPKAARHDWGRLQATVARVSPRPDQRWLLAYGPQQFAGIQVLLHVLAAQATLVAPFPRQPADGLHAILHDGVTCVSATPTYWRFLLAEARSRHTTLPPLEQITLGGEASPGDLLDDLRSVFPTARISHVYASTEFGSIASVRDGRPGLPVTALHSADHPAGNLRVEDGQLWVRSSRGMLGYAGDAVPTSSEPDGAWRPTGDLVEIVGDRVLFRGRDSEVINVGGVKVHPLPVEERITALPGVAAARVFGRANPLTGAIVAAEVVPAAGVGEAEQAALKQEIRDATADLPRAWQPRVVRFVPTLATRGEKTVRSPEP